MNEKDLIAKLNNGKHLSPDKEWLTSNRELFLTQIANSGAEKLSMWQIFSINLRCFAKASSQPVFASLLFLFILIASSVFSHKIFSEAKPNDTLYVARVISEKAKLNTVLDNTQRDKMAAKFAARHAEDISALLANPEFNTEENKEKVDKLSDDFNKEIETVKNKIAKLNSDEEKNRVVADDDEGEDNKEEEEGNSEIASTTSEEEVITIASDKLVADKGIELDIKEETEEDSLVTLEGDTALETIITNEVLEDDHNNISQGSSTEEIAGALLEEVENGKNIDEKLIEEVKTLFKAQKYSEAIEKLYQINNMLK
ncbi:MAG: hypothetical protein PHX76_03390 [Patescibacteria group bacterium]|jgi:hypothetical protein|nr:hypothetical protein [Patescibacteria group bacterium]MDD4444124.1 hypothetical protein [Patescibacteria group bacterium]